MPSIAFEIHPHCYKSNYQTENSKPKEADKAQRAKGHANQKPGEKGKCELIPLGEAHRNRMADAIGGVQQTLLWVDSVEKVHRNTSHEFGQPKRRNFISLWMELSASERIILNQQEFCSPPSTSAA